MSAGRVTTIDAAVGAAGNGRAPTLACPALQQEVWRLAPAERWSDGVRGRSEVLFVLAGEGTLRLNGDEHPLAPETGAFVAAGESLDIEADGGAQLTVLAVTTPPAEPAGPRVVKFADARPESAGIGREFRMLAQCSEATQFVGIVPPGRANMHNHPYDEIACIIEGEGVLHWHEGESIPVGVGSVIHFPRLVFHSLENVGRDDLRVIGVFHPAGSPADRVEVLDY